MYGHTFEDLCPSQTQYTPMSREFWLKEDTQREMWDVILPLLMDVYPLQAPQTTAGSLLHSLQYGIFSDHVNLAHSIPQTQKKLLIVVSAA